MVAKAKALTTRHDLSEGITEAAGRALRESGEPVSAIKLVSLSTTLATNALVEGQGGRVGLVLLGFTPADLARDGLSAALGPDPVLLLPGGHDVHANPRPLDLSALADALPLWSETVSGVAVCALFATRNPAHELAARALIREKTNLPVTLSHELSAKLGGPRRALTTLLNARLVGLISRLLDATDAFLAREGIAAPVTVVRGDGALVSSAFARARPIETILSGPAASLVGARHLTGLDNAVVSDIGGTTTDVAVLDNGRPRLDAEGATVGGHRTQVEAVAMRTFGLGGDSEVSLDDVGLTPRLTLGPRRLVPLSLLGMRFGPLVTFELDRQLRAPNPQRLDGRFALRTGLPDAHAAGLTPAERKLYDALTLEPQPLDRLLAATAQGATLDRLVARGLAHIAGLTPSDAAHTLGRQTNWDAPAARLGATLFARRRDGRGLPLAASPEALSERVLALLARRSAEAILETAFAEDGLDGPATVRAAPVQRALDGQPGVAALSLTLDRPVIGLGASAPLHYATLPALLHTPCHVPDDTDVANALGAVVGQVRVAVHAEISQPKDGLFRVTSGALVRDFLSEADALAWSEEEARARAVAAGETAGAAQVEVTVALSVQEATVEGQRAFIGARLTATASGRPRLGP